MVLAVRAALLLACGAPGCALGQESPPRSTAPATPSAVSSADRAATAPTASPPLAQASSAEQSSANTAEAGQLQEVTVSAQRLQLIGKSTTASQGVITGTEAQLTPAFRPGEVLETVPGLDV
ncbi:MAG TPA: hypothetical protein VMD56_00255, partial [Steroidobacteraceae bacterium]|nr:hypothetical protein [Steroidobacteraceae bacterium]